MKKKILSGIIIMSLILSLLIPITALADTTVITQDEALAWLYSVEGTSVGTPYGYYGECASLGYRYFEKILGRAVFADSNDGQTGHGKDYDDNNHSVNLGWSRVEITSSTSLQPGDIIVSNYEPFGHVAIFLSGSATNATLIHQANSSNFGGKVKRNSGNNLVGRTYVRPLWKGKTSSSSSTSTSSKPYIIDISRTLRWKELNSKYDKTVEELQQCLNYIMNAGLTVDGVYGISTHDAVKDFQSKYGLTVDGDAGPKTLKKVNEVIDGISGTCSHNYIIESETIHPHKEYRRCTSCDYTEYTGNNVSVNYCSQCVTTEKFDKNNYAVKHIADNGNEYRIYDYICSWEEAKELCEDVGGHLATITSRDEFDAVLTLVRKRGKAVYYYIGGTDKQNEGTWKWVTGEKWTFNDLWAAGEPNNDGGHEDYMSIYELANDLPATSHLGFICEIDNKTVEPESFRLNKNSIELKEGDTYTLTATVDPADSEYSIYWESNNSSVAKVNSKGKITAVSTGTTRIHAILLDSDEYQVDQQYCTVTVSKLHEHNYVSKYETKHPHKKYMECECGEIKQSTQTKKMEDCKECYPNIERKTLKLQIGIPDMYVNGKSQEIDPGRGTTPVIKNARTLLPIRAVVESFGAYVVWDENEEKVTVYGQNVTMQFWINSTDAIVNNEVCTMDVAPVIINGRTFMPLRFIAENMGLSVGWNEINQTVTIEGNI